jgi:hypothetical protein
LGLPHPSSSLYPEGLIPQDNPAENGQSLGTANPSVPSTDEQLHQLGSSEQPSQQLMDGTDTSPKVLLSIAFEEDQWLDKEEWLEWLLSIPALTKHAHLEAVFKSDSALLLVTLPVAVWDMLPEELSCSFLGFVYSRNMILDKTSTSCVKAHAHNFNEHGLPSKTGPSEGDSSSPKIKLGHDAKQLQGRGTHVPAAPTITQPPLPISAASPPGVPVYASAGLPQETLKVLPRKKPRYDHLGSATSTPVLSTAPAQAMSPQTNDLQQTNRSQAPNVMQYPTPEENDEFHINIAGDFLGTANDSWFLPFGGIDLTNVEASKIVDNYSSGQKDGFEMDWDRTLDLGLGPRSDGDALPLPPIVADTTDVALKRARNTRAARTSRQRKLERFEEMENEISRLKADRDHWKEMATDANDLATSRGLARN